jgi:hypothetical protein
MPKAYRLTNEHLIEVADTYRTALAAGEPPVQAVAARFDLRSHQAAKRVQAARSRGFLPRTTPGAPRA